MLYFFIDVSFALTKYYFLCVSLPVTMTLTKMLLMLGKATKRAIFYKDKNLFENKIKRELYQDIQIVFQHPESLLNHI